MLSSSFRLAALRTSLPRCAGIPLNRSALLMNEGERTVIEGPEGPIVLAKVKGTMYAVDGICPHMKKPMVDGTIEEGPEGPEIKCPLHNSKFCMSTGKCTKWVTGVLGMESKFVASKVRMVGGKQRDVAAYNIVSLEDGSLELQKKA
mmetsp:Transcript_4292/g.6060  ORF Transcript_4292/g.6060 Transcript_4292/m.6060 type:complete len:147 (-) Transcript_4292:474-914(-)